jgi:hypothetical protein
MELPTVRVSLAEVAARLCSSRGGSFREELEAHLLHGFVFSTPDVFLMGRPVPRSADVSDVWEYWPAAECDAWFVWLAVGRVGRLFSLMPWPLPWLGWVRQGRGWDDVHWWPTKRFAARIAAFESACAH